MRTTGHSAGAVARLALFRLLRGRDESGRVQIEVEGSFGELITTVPRVTRKEVVVRKSGEHNCRKIV